MRNLRITSDKENFSKDAKNRKLIKKIQQLDKLLKNNPTDEKLVELGDEYYEDGKSEKALEEYQATFALAKGCNLVTGFAIGRSIFWQPWLDFLAGKLKKESIATEIADRYRKLIQCWQQT